MSKIGYYSIAIYDDKENLVSSNVADFLNKIEDLLYKNVSSVLKTVNYEKVTISKFDRKNQYSKKEFVIKFGKLKSGATYTLSQDGKELLELDQSLFDINCMYYSEIEKVALLTVSHNGPSKNLIQDYLQTFLSDKYRVIIKKLKYSTGLKKVENAKYIKCITITLNLDAEDNKMCNDSDSKNERSMLSLLKTLASTSKQDLNSKTLNLTLGLGKGKQKTLEKEVALDLLSHLDVASDLIKEITVAYKNSDTEKIEPARLKHTLMDISENISADGAEYILDISDELISLKRNDFRETINKIKETPSDDSYMDIKDLITLK